MATGESDSRTGDSRLTSLCDTLVDVDAKLEADLLQSIRQGDTAKAKQHFKRWHRAQFADTSLVVTVFRLIRLGLSFLIFGALWYLIIKQKREQKRGDELYAYLISAFQFFFYIIDLLVEAQEYWYDPRKMDKVTRTMGYHTILPWAMLMALKYGKKVVEIVTAKSAAMSG
ncbi:hypothetical protein HD553DRAFT_314738 [Filobasidium floriforme]|uniref:uncharacterized protein n=1 Tax=Filobasidium floriforme TaxID=5210 RepID=UPI001E8D219B|nr:uncharacterized protein HD553DRAFT_314738 [Filobasidium floriforme]KAH8082378.1 hypothetical protein HD553DRAFT_314738 [Filobasidium floriforme]